MTDRTTELLLDMLYAFLIDYQNILKAAISEEISEKETIARQRATVREHAERIEDAIAATLDDEAPKKCSTCQYRYVVGQRPYPTFGYMCGFGDGKKLCGSNTSVLDHMGCEHWEKELR